MSIATKRHKTHKKDSACHFPLCAFCAFLRQLLFCFFSSMISSPSIIVSGFCRDKLQINRPLVNHHASRNVSGGLRINGPTFMLADRSENQNHTQSIEAEQRPSLPRDTQLRALRL